MLAKWKVIHRFSEGVLVHNPIVGYRSIAVSLYYEDNKLMRVEHELELDCDDRIESTQVINNSKQCLELFWELLRYRRGVSLPDISSSAQKVEPVNGSPAKTTGSVGVALDARLCSPIVMPNPNVFAHPSSRLLVWLRLANDAFDSCNAAYAIRNYYMIWEDLHPYRNYKEWPAKANDLRLTRHFVSHGGQLWKEVGKFIKRSLGRQIDQYDPTDSAQQQFVILQCKSARNLIETELDKLL